MKSFQDQKIRFRNKAASKMNFEMGAVKGYLRIHFLSEVRHHEVPIYHIISTSFHQSLRKVQWKNGLPTSNAIQVLLEQRGSLTTGNGTVFQLTWTQLATLVKKCTLQYAKNHRICLLLPPKLLTNEAVIITHHCFSRLFIVPKII